MSSKTEVEIEWLKAKIIPALKARNERHFPAECTVDDFHISFIGQEEAFMLTICYRARMQVQSQGATTTRALVVKKTPQLPQEIYDSIQFGGLFNNEIEAYERILPAIESFAGETIPRTHFYHSILERDFAAIALEDFNVCDWRMTKAKVDLPLDHTLLAVKHLAAFHGICFALKHSDLELYKRITTPLKEARFTDDEQNGDWAMTQHCSIQRIGLAAKKFQPGIPKDFMDRLQHLLREPHEYSKKRVAPVEPMVTICHGDYLRNNIAFKYAKDASGADTERPIEVLMFDFQTMRLASPMMDLIIFLALSTFAHVRHTNFERIFDAYCRELSSVYQKHMKRDLPDYLSRDSLLREYVRFMPYGLATAASFLFTLVDPVEISLEEMLLQQRTTEELKKDVLSRGGDVVDRELAHQAKELHDLSLRLDVDFITLPTV